MDKLLTNEGGQPFYLEDIDFMQNAIADSLKGIMQGLGANAENYVLYGCEVNVSRANDGVHSVTWTKGYIVIAGEVYPVPAGTINVSTGYTDMYWVVKNSQSGKRVYENGMEQYAYSTSFVALQAETMEGDVYVSQKETVTIANSLSRNLRDRYVQDPTGWNGLNGNFLRNTKAGIVNIGTNDIEDPAGKIFCIMESGSLDNDGTNYLCVQQNVGGIEVVNSFSLYYKGKGVKRIYITPGHYVLLRAIPTYDTKGVVAGAVYDIINTDDFYARVVGELFDSDDSEIHLYSVRNGCEKSFRWIQQRSVTLKISQLVERYYVYISNVVVTLKDDLPFKWIDQLDFETCFSILVMNDGVTIQGASFKSSSHPDGVNTLSLAKGKEYTFHLLPPDSGGLALEWYVTSSGTV